MLSEEQIGYISAGFILGIVAMTLAVGVIGFPHWTWYELIRDFAAIIAVLVAVLLALIGVSLERSNSDRARSKSQEADVQGMIVGIVFDIEAMIASTGKVMSFSIVAERMSYGTDGFAEGIEDLRRTVADEFPVNYNSLRMLMDRLGWLSEDRRHKLVTAFLLVEGARANSQGFMRATADDREVNQRISTFMLLSLASAAARAFAACIEAQDAFAKGGEALPEGLTLDFSEEQWAMVKDLIPLNDHLSTENAHRVDWVPVIQKWAKTISDRANEAAAPYMAALSERD